MSCETRKDCNLKGLKCDKRESHLFCSRYNGCACTLPKTSVVSYIVCILVVILIAYMLLPCSSTPHFIAKSTFCGAKKGYVFKTENGVTGYYLDTKKYK